MYSGPAGLSPTSWTDGTVFIPPPEIFSPARPDMSGDTSPFRTSAARSALDGSSKRPNTVGPEPLMAAPRAPWSSRAALMARISAPSSSVSTRSNTFPRQPAAADRSPARRARSMAAVSGRSPRSAPSTRAKSSGVGRSKSGLHKIIVQSGRGGRSVRTSPLPSARQVPPRTQKGTSLPTARPISSRVSRGSSGAYRARRHRSTAAASALPPPRPA